MGLLGNNRIKAPKQVACFHCGRPTEVGARAMSIPCPHCHKRLILQDYKISSYHGASELFTCGDIVVEKKGHVVAPIKASTLTIQGKVQGNVDVRSRVTIAKTAWFRGDISAPNLIVESGAVLEGYLRIGPVSPPQPPPAPDSAPS